MLTPDASAANVEASKPSTFSYTPSVTHVVEEPGKERKTTPTGFKEKDGDEAALPSPSPPSNLHSNAERAVSPSNLLADVSGGPDKRFSLTKNFVNRYKDVKAPFGYNGLGELVYRRTYSRTKLDGVAFFVSVFS